MSPHPTRRQLLKENVSAGVAETDAKRLVQWEDCTESQLLPQAVQQLAKPNAVGPHSGALYSNTKETMVTCDNTRMSLTYLC